jgi:hypothetical protein
VSRPVKHFRKILPEVERIDKVYATSRPFAFLVHAFETDDFLTLRPGVKKVNPHGGRGEEPLILVAGVCHAGDRQQKNCRKMNKGSHDGSYFLWLVLTEDPLASTEEEQDRALVIYTA